MITPLDEDSLLPAQSLLAFFNQESQQTNPTIGLFLSDHLKSCLHAVATTFPTPQNANESATLSTCTCSTEPTFPPSEHQASMNVPMKHYYAELERYVSILEQHDFDHYLASSDDDEEIMLNADEGQSMASANRVKFQFSSEEEDVEEGEGEDGAMMEDKFSNKRKSFLSKLDLKRRLSSFAHFAAAAPSKSDPSSSDTSLPSL
jgi:hypothetical protein